MTLFIAKSKTGVSTLMLAFAFSLSIILLVTINKAKAQSCPNPIITANGPTLLCSGGNVNLSAVRNNLQFNGSNQSADLGTWFNYPIFTVSMWLKPDATQIASASIIDNNHTSGRSWYVEQNAGTNDYIFKTLNNAGGNSGITFSLTADVWQHLAIVVDATTQYIYLNGVLQGSMALSGSPTVYYDGTQHLYLGAWGGGGRNWKGEMQDVRIYNDALSQANVNASMSGLVPSASGNFLAWYLMNQSSGSSLTDSKGNFNGTLINNPTWVTTAYASYLWSNGATTSNINVTATGNYVVTVTYPTNTCSNASNAATVSVNPNPVSGIPTNLLATPASVCPGASSNLSAQADVSAGQHINWYDSITGGNLLGSSLSGANFTVTPSSVNTTYYAKSENNFSATFNYTGSVQTYVVPQGVYSISVDAQGARGGHATEQIQTYGGAYGGNGGRVRANMNVTPGQVLYLYVGGKGAGFTRPANTYPIAGWNGGGTMNIVYLPDLFGGTGGGATDIRLSGQALTDRVLVAGGGGGGGISAGGGGGGNVVGGTGDYNSTVGGKGGSQISGGSPGCYIQSVPICGNAGSFGTGGSSTPSRLFIGSPTLTGGGAGGGGWYGGGGGDGTGGGGGGSSYTDPVLFQNIIHTQGYNDNNGKLVITCEVGANCNVTTTRVPVTVYVGPPSGPVFGVNEWKVYAWGEGGASNTGNSWKTNFSGYYTAQGLNFNTENDWNKNSSPSSVPNYIGCTVGANNHSWSARRQGFPCGYYTFSITGHDDAAELYINDSLIWQHVGYGDAHSNVWAGYLSTNSKVEFRATEGTGDSYGGLTLSPTPFLITASGTVLCNNNTVSLTATVLPGTYLWSGGQTTSSISTTTSGVYSVTLTTDIGCTLSSSLTVTDVVPPSIILSGSGTNCKGSGIALNASGAAYYIWSPNPVALDDNLSATLAVGLHKLNNDYSGNILQLRRSTDNAIMDFGLAGNDLDVATVTTWLAGADGYCTVLYDQSGNGNNITQPVSTNQPQFIANGINGKPVLHFSTSHFMQKNKKFLAPYSVVYGARQNNAGRQRVLSSINNNWLLGWWNGNKSQAYYDGWCTNTTIAADSKSYIYSATGDGVNSTFYENGLLLGPNDNSLPGPDGIQLNGRNGINEMSDCDFMDVMIFDSALPNSQRSNVENIISSYYGLFISGSQQVIANPTTATVYTVTGADIYGCTGTSSIVVNVNTPPVINCPADVSANLPAGSCSMTINYNAATASGNLPINISYSNNSGTLFQAGITLVSVTATDANGCTDVCTFNVIVNDVTPISIVCPTPVTVNTTAGMCGALINFAPVVSDCPITISETIEFNYTGAIQKFVVPQNWSNINLTAIGAGGGNLNINEIPGGAGTSMSGDFATTPGETLYFLVGQKGASSNSLITGAGGGGGTFVSRDSLFISNLILAAGGGGGGGFNGLTSNDATISTHAKNGSYGSMYGGGSGGANGTGGESVDGGGGGGWLTNGSDTYSNYGYAPRYGGYGGTGYAGNPNGGYGGGGGAYNGSGGGGGYSGGGGADDPTIVISIYTYTLSGGGGGSYNIGSNQINTEGVSTGNGKVIISYNLSYPKIILTSGVQPGNAFPVGTTTNTWTVIDSAGNIATCSSSVTVIDNEAPVVHGIDITVGADSGQCSKTFNYALPYVTDNCCPAISGYTPLGNYAGHSYYLSTNPLNWNDANNAAIALGGQLTSINSAIENEIISNAIGNTSVWIGGFQNHANPGFSEPSGGWQWLDGTPFNTFINWGSGEPNNAGGIEDNIQFNGNGFWNDASQSSTLQYVVELTSCINPVLVSGPASGGNFPIGTTTVTYSATDVNGNTGTGAFTVTVIDNVKPIILTCTPPITGNTNINCQAALPDFTLGVIANDNCTASNLLIVSQSPAVGTLFNKGTYPVTVTVTDATGNSATCISTFTVEDHTPPVINCSSPIVVNAALGQCNAVVNFSPPSLTENCPDLLKDTSIVFSFTGGVQSFTVPNGITTLHIEAMGAQGGKWVGGSFTGKGAKVITDLPVTPGQNLNLFVGGEGEFPTGLAAGAGGYNGGGQGGDAVNYGLEGGGGGGGASDIRFGGNAIVNRVVVAGGGGGNSDGGYGLNSTGGDGGENGNNGHYNWQGFASGGGGATQGNIGNGGTNLFNIYAHGLAGIANIGGNGGVPDSYMPGLAGGGGGGGYYGGGGGAGGSFDGYFNIDAGGGGGGGGSSYSIAPATYISGFQSGNGEIIITYYYPISSTIAQTAGPVSGSTFPIGNTLITWTASDPNGNTSSCTQTITVNDTRPPVVITPSGTTSFCNGGGVNLAADAGYSSYNWSNGSTTQTISANTADTFTVTVSTANGCTGSASVTTTVNTNLTPSISGSLSFCSGSSTTLNAGSGYTSYNWSSGATTQTIAANTPATFTVTVTNANGCTGSSSVTTIVTPGPTPISTTNITQNTAIANWVSAGIGVKYFIEKRVAGTLTFDPGRTTNKTSLQMINMTQNTNYEWHVRVVCSPGQYSEWSALMPFTTIGVVCTNKPTGLFATKIATNEATVNWSLLGPIPDRYQIRYRIVGAATWSNTRGIGTSVKKKITGLTAASNYEWQLRGKCGIADPYDFSLWSTTAYFSTLATARFANDLETENEIYLALYPNPTTGIVTVTLNACENCSYQLNVYDVLGHLVYNDKNKADGNSKTIDLSTLAKGIYQVQVLYNDEISNCKLVMQ